MQARATFSRITTSSNWRFIWNFVQLQIAMCIGALVCYLLGLVVPASSGLGRVYYWGAYLYTLGDVLFLVLGAEVVGPGEALPLFSPSVRRLVWLARIRQLLNVHATPQSGNQPVDQPK